MNAPWESTVPPSEQNSATNPAVEAQLDAG